MRDRDLAYNFKLEIKEKQKLKNFKVSASFRIWICNEAVKLSYN